MRYAAALLCAIGLTVCQAGLEAQRLPTSQSASAPRRFTFGKSDLNKQLRLSGVGDTYACSVEVSAPGYYMIAVVSITDPYNGEAARASGADWDYLRVTATFTVETGSPSGTYTCTTAVYFYDPWGNLVDYWDGGGPDYQNIDNDPCGYCWPNVVFQRGMIITFRYHDSFPEPFQPYFQSSVDAWNAYSYQLVGGAEPTNVVVYMEDVSPDLGRTAAGPAGGSIRIDDGMNNGWNLYFVQAVLSHEIGHMFGMDDVYDEGPDCIHKTVMYYASAINQTDIPQYPTCSDESSFRYGPRH